MLSGVPSTDTSLLTIIVQMLNTTATYFFSWLTQIANILLKSIPIIIVIAIGIVSIIIIIVKRNVRIRHKKMNKERNKARGVKERKSTDEEEESYEKGDDTD